MRISTTSVEKATRVSTSYLNVDTARRDDDEQAHHEHERRKGEAGDVSAEPNDLSVSLEYGEIRMAEIKRMGRGQAVEGKARKPSVRKRG